MALVELIEGGNAGERRFRLRSPATLDVAGEFVACSADDVRVAVELARKAQRDWGELAYEERARFLKRAWAQL